MLAFVETLLGYLFLYYVTSLTLADGKHVKYKSHNYATSSNQNRRFKANAVESDMCYVIFLGTQSH